MERQEDPVFQSLYDPEERHDKLGTLVFEAHTQTDTLAFGR